MESPNTSMPTFRQEYKDGLLTVIELDKSGKKISEDVYEIDIRDCQKGSINGNGKKLKRERIAYIDAIFEQIIKNGHLKGKDEIFIQLEPEGKQPDPKAEEPNPKGEEPKPKVMKSLHIYTVKEGQATFAGEESVDARTAGLFKETVGQRWDHVNYPLPSDPSLKRMAKNTYKAWMESGFKDPLVKLEDPTLSKPLQDLVNPETVGEYEAQGPRPAQEDSHMYCCKIEGSQGGALAGVFDGHGDGQKISSAVATNYARHFEESLVYHEKDVCKAFEKTTADLQEFITRDSPETAKKGGTTAVTSYIHDGLIYTATLGDSECLVFRKINGKVTAIPLSCVRDWTSPKDSARGLEAELVHEEEKDRIAKSKEPTHSSRPEIDLPGLKDTEWWHRFKNPKRRRVNRLNVSRSIGDDYTSIVDKKTNTTLTPTKQKPKVTVFPLHEGDRVLWVCDGVMDYLLSPEDKKESDTKGENSRTNGLKKLESVVADNWDAAESALAESVGEFALNNMGFSGDNVSVLAMKVKKKPAAV